MEQDDRNVCVVPPYLSRFSELAGSLPDNRGVREACVALALPTRVFPGTADDQAG